MKTDALSISDAPFVLLIGPKSPQNIQMRQALERGGWRFAAAENQPEARSVCREAPVSLILVDVGESPELADEAIGVVRTLSGPSRAVPILTLEPAVGLQNAPLSSRVDGAVRHDPDCASHLARELDNWRPVSLEPTRRIASIFGPGQIARMIERLGRRLEAAMIGLEEGRADKAEAHRLAGLCGTLGFAQAHAAWLDLSHDAEPSLEEVRRTTRLTLAAIARGL